VLRRWLRSASQSALAWTPQSLAAEVKHLGLWARRKLSNGRKLAGVCYACSLFSSLSLSPWLPVSLSLLGFFVTPPLLEGSRHLWLRAFMSLACCVISRFVIIPCMHMLCVCSKGTELWIRLVRVGAQSERLLNKQAHQSGLRRAFRILLKPHEKRRPSSNVLLNIYSANIVVSLAVLPVH